jgi:hypothetical protein
MSASPSKTDILPRGRHISKSGYGAPSKRASLNRWDDFELVNRVAWKIEAIVYR